MIRSLMRSLVLNFGTNCFGWSAPFPISSRVLAELPDFVCWRVPVGLVHFVDHAFLFLDRIGRSFQLEAGHQVVQRLLARVDFTKGIVISELMRRRVAVEQSVYTSQALFTFPEGQGPFESLVVTGHGSRNRLSQYSS